MPSILRWQVALTATRRIARLRASSERVHACKCMHPYTWVCGFWARGPSVSVGPVPSGLPAPPGPVRAVRLELQACALNVAPLLGVQDEELARDQTVYIMGEEVGDYQG